jgi:predicted RNase H-like HicB family nuclease
MNVIEVDVEPLEEGGYMAVCESIQGCRAEGHTVGEALENLEDVARILLELRKADGLPVPPGLETYEPGRKVKAQLVVSAGD